MSYNNIIIKVIFTCGSWCPLDGLVMSCPVNVYRRWFHYGFIDVFTDIILYK